jgi:hypothetical protein
MQFSGHLASKAPRSPGLLRCRKRRRISELVLCGFQGPVHTYILDNCVNLLICLILAQWLELGSIIARWCPVCCATTAEMLGRQASGLRRVLYSHFDDARFSISSAVANVQAKERLTDFSLFKVWTAQLHSRQALMAQPRISSLRVTDRDLHTFDYV